MSINLMISVTREQQVAIEEYCINHSLSISEYLVGLHNAHQFSLVAYPKPQKFSTFMEECKEIIESSEMNEAAERQLKEGMQKKTIPNELKSKKK